MGTGVRPLPEPPSLSTRNRVRSLSGKNQGAHHLPVSHTVHRTLLHTNCIPER